MNEPDLNKLLNVAKSIMDLELTLAEFYRQCGIVWLEDQTFWNNIAKQEEQHAEYLKQIISLVSAKPNEFEAGRTFNETAIKTIKSGIVAQIDKLKNGLIPGNRILFIARDFENSLIEAKYIELFKTHNVEYREIMNKINSETSDHKKWLSAMISKSTER